MPETTAWTAGQLRKALEGVPGDLPVLVITPDGDEHVVSGAEPWAHTPGTAGSVRARLAAGELKPDHFEIGLEYPEDDNA